MYGIPNMKLSKKTVDRRVDLLREEGIEFVVNADIGASSSDGGVDIDELRESYDALALCVGSTTPRDLEIPGRDLNGVHFAMEFLTKNQKRLLVSREGNLESNYADVISAAGKDVVVIGGGDTGTDCIGTSMRHRCKSIVNFEMLPKPPSSRSENNPWPEWPRTYGVDYGHAEVQAVFGEDPREYSVVTKEFVGDEDGNLKGIVTEEVAVNSETGALEPKAGSEKEWPCQLAILSMGFIHPESYIANKLGLELDQRKNIHAVHGDFSTNLEGVFAAGDCRRGQSLVVWAINEGRGVAENIDKFLEQSARRRVGGYR